MGKIETSEYFSRCHNVPKKVKADQQQNQILDFCYCFWQILLNSTTLFWTVLYDLSACLCLSACSYTYIFRYRYTGVHSWFAYDNFIDGVNNIRKPEAIVSLILKKF